MIGGVLAGCGWWLLRRRTTLPSLSDTIARHERIPRLMMNRRRTTGAAGGHRRVTGARGCAPPIRCRAGDLGTSRWSLTPGDREILLACAAGASLAAVYSVPVGGALFAVRILLHTPGTHARLVPR